MAPIAIHPVAPEARPIYNKNDFVSDQEVRWCPGCGDYSILGAVQQTIAVAVLQIRRGAVDIQLVVVGHGVVVGVLLLQHGHARRLRFILALEREVACGPQWVKNALVYQYATKNDRYQSNGNEQYRGKFSMELIRAIERHARRCYFALKVYRMSPPHGSELSPVFPQSSGKVCPVLWA